MNTTANLTKGQAVTFDATGLGHIVRATYVGPVKGGHKVKVMGKVTTIRKAPKAV